MLVTKTRTCFLFFFICCLGISGQVHAQETCTRWDGNVGGHPAEICFSVDHGRVSGSYFYFRYGKPIKVSGAYNSGTGETSLSEQGGSASWRGELSLENKEFSGTWTDNGRNLPFHFFDIQHTATIIKHHKRVFKICSEQNPEDVSFNWDVLEAIPNKELMAELNSKIADLVENDIKNTEGLAPPAEEPANISDTGEAKHRHHHVSPKYRREGGACISRNTASEDDEPPQDYSENSYYRLTPFGKFLLELDASEDSYTGGAHSNAGTKIEFYDIRSGSKFGFSDLFNAKGRKLLIDKIKSDMGNMDGCEIDLNTSWGLYPPSAKHSTKQEKNTNLTMWGIIFGTYAFGCTGRPGYNIDAIPKEVVEKGLNPEFFDPETKFFYE